MKEKRSRWESFTDRFPDLRNYLNSTRKPLTKPIWNVLPPGLQRRNPTQLIKRQDPGKIDYVRQKAGPMSWPQITRQKRRLYVGRIPSNISKSTLMHFFNQQLGVCSILSCQLFPDQKFAFLEFRSVEETTKALALDGILLMDHNLKIRRPFNYHQSPGSQSSDSEATTYVDVTSPNVIYIGALPDFISDGQVKELLLIFGELRTFKHIRDKAGLSRGFAFCEYVDAGVTDQAVDALNWLQICDRKLIVQRASRGAKKPQQAPDQSLVYNEDGHPG